MLTDLLIAIACLPLIIVWTTYAHEMSHVYFVRRRGGRNFKVYPWWHWYRAATGAAWYVPFQAIRKPTADAALYFGRMSYEGKPLDGAGEVEHVAPLLFDALMIVLYVTLMIVFGTTNAFLLLLAAGALVDAFVWLYGYFWGGPLTDGYRYRYGLSRRRSSTGRAPHS